MCLFLPTDLFLPTEVGALAGTRTKAAAVASPDPQTLEGSFSAVSKRNFASKFSFESSRRDLHNALLRTALQSQFFATFLLVFLLKCSKFSNISENNSNCLAICFFFFCRQNCPATAAPLQEGRFWKRAETKKRILRVAQNAQMRTALQELP